MHLHQRSAAGNKYCNRHLGPEQRDRTCADEGDDTNDNSAASGTNDANSDDGYDDEESATASTDETCKVVTVTKTEISIAGKMTDAVKDAAAGTGELKGLALALAKPASPDAPVIIQADQDTVATVINRIVSTVKTAGYNNVLFAVKNK